MMLTRVPIQHIRIVAIYSKVLPSSEIRAFVFLEYVIWCLMKTVVVQVVLVTDLFFMFSEEV